MRHYFFTISKFGSLLLFSILFIFIAFPRPFVEPRNASSTRIGAWNRFLNQTNIVECINPSDLPIRAKFTVRSSSGQDIREDQIAIAGRASYHYLLDSFTAANSYGTYSVELVDGDLGLQCSTIFYGMQGAKPHFSYSLPLLAEYSGNLFGLFNSFNPTSPDKLVANWLAIYNPSPTALSLDILVYSLSGELLHSIPVVELGQYARTDIALGHPFGQQVGSYEIRPRDPQQPYGAYLGRFVLNDTNVSTAYSLLPLAGSGINSVVSTSTMGNALNWLEIGNTTNSPISILLKISSQTGNILNSERLELPAHSQQHIFVNKFLGPLAIGKAEIECISSQCKHTDIIFQSLYYGINGEKLGWAYGSQGLPMGNGNNQQFDFPVNTFLNAANWLKLFSTNTSVVNLPFSIYGGSGSKMTAPSNISIKGTGDIALHESYEKDSYGAVSLAPQPDGIISELIRVFPGEGPGGIQHINLIRSISEFNNAFNIAREQDINPGNLRGRAEAIERRQVEVDGVNVEKVFIRGWACRKRSTAPVNVEVKLGDVVLGSGIANLYHANNTSCPGLDYREFEFEINLPSDTSLIGDSLTVVAMDQLGESNMALNPSIKSLSPSLLFSAFDNRYPKGIFFRVGGLEGIPLKEHRESDPARWEADLTSLDGAFAHVPDDSQVPFDPQAISDGLNQLGTKSGQLVLAQFSAVGMLPTTVISKIIKPQDWLYFAGCDSLGPIGETDTTVLLPEECFSRFRKCVVGPNTGLPRAPECNPENLVAVSRNADNSLDWSKSEYLIVDDLELIQFNPSEKRTKLIVRRGQFDRQANQYPIRAYLAAVSHNGPWSLTSPQTLWDFNFHSSSARENVTKMILSYFEPDGLLHKIDGVTLDVSWWYRKGRLDADSINQIPGRQIDIDNNGVPDGGYSGSVNLYGKGVSQFHRQLREALGQKKLL